MEWLQEREQSTRLSTPGKLYLLGDAKMKFFECFTLEDVARLVKIDGETAIPAGRYRIVIDKSVRFSKLKGFDVFMPHILDVPNFTGVRYHSLNWASQSKGCVGVGRVRSSPDEILESHAAYDAFFKKLNAAEKRGENIFVTIRDWIEPREIGVEPNIPQQGAIN